MQHEKQSDLESDFTFVLQHKLPLKKKRSEVLGSQGARPSFHSGRKALKFHKPQIFLVELTGSGL